LLRILEIAFEVEIADIDETRLENESPPNMVARLSKKKASEIAQRIGGVIVVGADTIVVLGDRILEKPRTHDEAAEMLKSLSGKTHTVYTGVSVIEAGPGSASNRHTGFVEKTLVTFGELSDNQINHYIKTGSPFDKAGAYGIQDDRGALFVEKIDGDFYNVMGLPIFRLNQLLHSEFASLIATE